MKRHHIFFLIALVGFLISLASLAVSLSKADARWAKKGELRLDDEITQTLSVQDSLAIAEEFWGSSCSEYHVYLVPSLPHGERAVSADGVPCFMWMSEAYVQDTVESRVLRCDDIVHEFGHWTGHPHSDNPISIMWPDVWATVRNCFERFVPDGQKKKYKRDHDVVWATK